MIEDVASLPPMATKVTTGQTILRFLTVPKNGWVVGRHRCELSRAFVGRRSKMPPFSEYGWVSGARFESRKRGGFMRVLEYDEFSIRLEARRPKRGDRFCAADGRILLARAGDWTLGTLLGSFKLPTEGDDELLLVQRCLSLTTK